MRIVLAPMGTEGDVIPMVALALELRRRGHRVNLAAPANFAGLASKFGLAFQMIGINTAETMLSGRFSIDSLRLEVDRSFAGLIEACKQSDVVVGSAFQLAAPSVAEYYGAKFYLMITAPVFVEIIQKFRWLTELVPSFNQWRSKLRLAEIGDVAQHLLNGGPILDASESDVLKADLSYTSAMTTTGTWFLDYKFRPLPKTLIAFCQQEPKPIYVGFGSMVQQDQAATATAVIDALYKTDSRAVISLGLSGLTKEPFPERCFVIPRAEHTLLFQHVAAAIHHGGAGTTAAALSAGIPQGIVPHMADQMYWGQLIAGNGVGVSLSKEHELTSENLELMIRGLTADQQLISRSKEISRCIDRSRGTRTTADLLERS